MDNSLSQEIKLNQIIRAEVMETGLKKARSLNYFGIFISLRFTCHLGSSNIEYEENGMMMLVLSVMTKYPQIFAYLKQIAKPVCTAHFLLLLYFSSFLTQ